jgi:hypothetical protein
MAYSGKAEQRLASSLNYKGATSTLDSTSVKGPKDMGNNGPHRLIGTVTSGGNSNGLGRRGLIGATVSGNASGIAGPRTASGYPDGPKWKRAMEPGEQKPGTYAQAKNTTRMTPGQGRVAATMKTTGSTPKAFRGGR